MKKMPYSERIRGYEADKRLMIPKCETTAEVEELLRTLREKWRI